MAKVSCILRRFDFPLTNTFRDDPISAKNFFKIWRFLCVDGWSDQKYRDEQQRFHKRPATNFVREYLAVSPANISINHPGRNGICLVNVVLCVSCTHYSTYDFTKTFYPSHHSYSGGCGVNWSGFFFPAKKKERRRNSTLYHSGDGC